MFTLLNVRTCRQVLQAIQSIVEQTDASDFASRIIHPIVRLLEKTTPVLQTGTLN